MLTLIIKGALAIMLCSLAIAIGIYALGITINLVLIVREVWQERNKNRGNKEMNDE